MVLAHQRLHAGGDCLDAVEPCQPRVRAQPCALKGMLGRRQTAFVLNLLGPADQYDRLALACLPNGLQEKLMEAALPTLMFNLVFKRVEKGAGGSEHTGRTWIDLSKHRWVRCARNCSLFFAHVSDCYWKKIESSGATRCVLPGVWGGVHVDSSSHMQPGHSHLTGSLA